MTSTVYARTNNKIILNKELAINRHNLINVSEFNRSYLGLNLCSLKTKRSDLNFFMSSKTIGLKFSLKIGGNK
jgi:hypothetical protein